MTPTKNTPTIKIFPAYSDLVTPNKLDIVSWLKEEAKNYKWFLAHANDGVLWGKVVNGQLLTADGSGVSQNSYYVPPRFSHTTPFQQARLFDETKELFVWCDGDGEWHGRVIQDDKSSTTGKSKDGIPCWHSFYDEAQILWGDYAKKLDDNFSLLEEGQQGIYQIVPLVLHGDFDKKNRPPHLVVRHYLSTTDIGFTYVSASRLVDLELVKGESYGTQKP